MIIINTYLSYVKHNMFNKNVFKYLNLNKKIQLVFIQIEDIKI